MALNFLSFFNQKSTLAFTTQQMNLIIIGMELWDLFNGPSEKLAAKLVNLTPTLIFQLVSCLSLHENAPLGLKSNSIKLNFLMLGGIFYKVTANIPLTPTDLTKFITYISNIMITEEQNNHQVIRQL